MSGTRRGQVEKLKGLAVFRALPPRDLETLAGRLGRRVVEKGETLLQEGQACDRFLIVVEGRLNILKTSTEGREKIVAAILPRQHFGLAEIITGRRSNATIEATERSVVLTLSKDDFVRTLLDSPQMCFKLMQVMAGTIMDLSDQIQEVSFERVSVRLARLLVSLDDREGLSAGGRRVVSHRYSHQEMGRWLGASRETITRMLKRFRDLGLVATDHRQLVVLDRKGLLATIERGGLEDEPEGVE